jgi:hypothetical protein
MRSDLCRKGGTRLKEIGQSVGRTLGVLRQKDRWQVNEQDVPRTLETESPITE